MKTQVGVEDGRGGKMKIFFWDMEPLVGQGRMLVYGVIFSVRVKNKRRY